ncbi:cysteine-rich secretory protein 3 [Ochotona princeps]|uniref:cysteine-rich secretory protein 3 n=1 Tax=Ochotona princeps TaxID=9978 RepID=UPI0027145CAE|nr:cysteine-rich secretory protein 3 [Ochotona princeps]
MALLPVLLFLAAALNSSFSANRNSNSAATLSTNQIEVQGEIVNKHNELRRSVDPTASNMLKMNWNNQTAVNAQKWANQCKLQHSNSEDRKTNLSCGENLFMSTAPSSWSDAIQAWYDEQSDFVYGKGPTSRNAVTGHYTQVAWYASHSIGCGYAYCPNENFKHYYVCQYCPAGNFQNRQYFPYNKGKPCDDCPTHCDNGLCTNPCEYQNNYSNCDQLKEQVSCTHPLVKDNCKASCLCTDKIYEQPYQ